MEQKQKHTQGKRRGLTALLVAQFMGAANDNILKTLLGFSVVRGMWEGKLGEGGHPQYRCGKDRIAFVL